MAILASIGVLVLLTIVAAFIYWISTKHDATVTLNEGEIDLKNSPKKYAVGNANSYKRVAFFSGLFITLLFVTILIEYKEFEVKEIIDEGIVERIEDLIDIPITYPPLPKPPKAPTGFVERPDEQIVVDKPPLIPETLDNSEPDGIPEEPDELIDDNNLTFDPELRAEYPGGIKKLFGYVYSSFNYPQRDIDAGNSGTIHVKFIIEKDGSVSSVSVIRGINERLDAEAIRVVKNMPKWKPARNMGRKVRMVFSLPIRLRISND